MDTQRASVLPSSLPPVGISREAAAAFIGVSPTTFDRLVVQRIMPQPRRIGARKVWDVEELREAFRHLPHDGEDEALDLPAKSEWD